MSTIHVIESHDQLLELWRSHGRVGLRIAHVDFHCDMRGLLVDRQSRRAYVMNPRAAPDEGNFLTQAIAEGRIQSIRWTHHVPGGRRYDVGTVMYASDLTMQPRRWWYVLTRATGIPLDYEVVEFAHWAGWRDGEFLDIDWDFFAAREYPLDTIDARVDAFFDRPFSGSPEEIAVCYSPRYSHPTRDRFEAFVDRLARRFDATVMRVPAGATATMKPRRPWLVRQWRHVHYESTLWLRKWHIY